MHLLTFTNYPEYISYCRFTKERTRHNPLKCTECVLRTHSVSCDKGGTRLSISLHCCMSVYKYAFVHYSPRHVSVQDVMYRCTHVKNGMKKCVCVYAFACIRHSSISSWGTVFTHQVQPVAPGAVSACSVAM